MKGPGDQGIEGPGDPSILRSLDPFPPTGGVGISFLQRILGKGSAGGSTAVPQVYVGAFGKHPGWDDHIDDLGLETDRLIGFKRMLYLDGIGAAIDSGAWDKLHESQQVEGFRHVVLWRVGGGGGDLVVARLWSSQDGKGRARYPMVVCAQCRALPLPWVLENVLPALERLEQRCRATTSAQEVHAAVDGARQQLRELARGVPPGQPEVMLPRRILADLADLVSASAVRAPGSEADPRGPTPETRPHEGLLRVLYQVEREMGAFKSATPGTRLSRTRVDAVQAQHMRVPVCAEAPGAALMLWMQFLLSQLDRAAPIMLILPLGDAGVGGWLDVIVGEPSGSQFFCIRAGSKAIPLTTDIPYTLESDFVVQAQDQIERLRTAEVEPLGSPGASGMGGGTGAAESTAPRAGKQLILVLVVGAVLLVLVVVVVAIALMGPSGAKPAAPEPPKPGDAVPAPPLAAVPTGDAAQGQAGGAWKDLCAAHRDWYGAFRRKLEEKPGPEAGAAVTRREWYRTDTSLAALMTSIEQAENAAGPLDPWAIASVGRDRDLQAISAGPPPAVGSAEGVQKTQRALALVRSVGAGLSVEHWPTLRRLADLGAEFDRRGWGTAGSALKSLAVSIVPGKGVDVPARVDAVLGAAALAEGVDGRWQKIQQAAQVLRATNDPVLSAFGDYASSASRRVAGRGDVQELLDEGALLEPIEELGRRLADFTRQDWETIDHDLFAQNGKAYAARAAASAPSREMFQDWLLEAPRFRSLDPAANPLRTWEADRLLAEIDQKRTMLESRYRLSPDQAILDRVDSLRGRVTAVTGLAWNTKNQERIQAEARAIPTELKGVSIDLDKKIGAAGIAAGASAAQVRDSLRATTQVVARSEVINQVWLALRDRLLLQFKDDAQYEALAKAAREMGEALVGIDKQVPQSPAPDTGAGALGAALTDAATVEREQRLKTLLDPWVQAGAERASPELQTGIARTAKEYGDWLASLNRLGTDLHAVEAMLESAYGPDEAGPDGVTIDAILKKWPEDSLIGASTVKPAARVLLDRVDALRRIALLSDPAPLAQAAHNADRQRPELAVAGWRRLGQLPDPGWPSSPEQLADERRIYEWLRRIVDGLPEARKQTLAQELDREGQVRWTRAFARLTDQAGIDAAAEHMAEFGVQPDRLEPWMRYNLALAALRRAVGQGAATHSDAAAGAQALAFAGQVHSLAAGVAQRPEVAGLVREVEAIAGGEQAAQPTIDPKVLGPGAANGGWVGSIDGGVLRFTRAASGGGQGATQLDFIRIEPDGKGVTAPVYLGTMEVSLGVFLQVVSAAGKWEQVAKLLPAPDPSGVDLRDGPRVWVWAPAGTGGPAVRVADEWLRRLSPRPPTEDYPPGLYPGKPSEADPMQQIPPAAAMYVASLAGCRLPTSAEWQAAYAAQWKEVERRTCNLRDETWKKQYDHVATMAEARIRAVWPYDGAFWPSAAGDSKKGRTSQVAPWDDGVLWFSRVDSDVDRALHHLVGNVAEFVFEDAAGAEAVKDSAPEAVQALLARSKGSVHVIGGSALSAPIAEEPPDAPLGVDPDEAQAGYADVGFRLAFSATGTAPPREPLAARLGRTVSGAVFLRP